MNKDTFDILHSEFDECPQLPDSLSKTMSDCLPNCLSNSLSTSSDLNKFRIHILRH